jgi:2-polyprenyl-6-methoxyphenol hydroxylase-like FAD-dependent oxidoreductase
VTEASSSKRLDRIAVIGAGVAGSAAALALTRLGAEVAVYEAYPDPAGPVGSFLSLAANGLNCLDALGDGLTAAVAGAGFDVPLQRMWSARGKCLGQVARNRRATDARPSVTVRRADLVEALREAARAGGAVIETGARIADPEHLRALTREADLVVGADGMWSVTRTLLDPDALAPRYARVYSVSGTAAAPGAGIDPEPGVFNMVFSRGGAFIHLTAPDGSIWWNAQVSDRIEPGREQLARLTPGDLATVFRDSRQAAAILADAAIETRTLTHVLPATPRRHDERTVLIGDAVHPVGAGQGASMALEDAVVLTRLLADVSTGGSSVPEALAAFDQARQKRLKKMTVSARRNREAKTMGPIQARARDVIMPIVFPRAYPAATNWLYDFEPGFLPVPAPR